MGKLNVRGSAGQDFPADRFRLRITVTAELPVSGDAARAGTEYTEALLKQLSDGLSLQPEDLTFGEESVRRSYGNEPQFVFTKTVTAVIPGDMKTLGAVTARLGSLANTEYGIEPLLSTQADCEKQVLKAAVADSRAKAELIAEAMGLAVTGADAADFEYGSNDEPNFRAAKCMAAGCDSALADRLQNPVIRIEKSVGITWLTAPAEGSDAESH